MLHDTLKTLVINWLDLYFIERKKNTWHSYTGMAMGFIKATATGKSDEEKKKEICDSLKKKALLVENTDGWITFINALIQECDSEPGLLRDVAHGIRNHIVNELREYDIWLMPTMNPMTNERLYEEKNRIYVKKNEKGLLEYTLITPDKKIVTDSVNPAELGLDTDFDEVLTMSSLRKIFRPLLKITEARKHTHIKDKDSFNAFHDARQKLIDEKNVLEKEHHKIQFENAGQDIGKNQKSRVDNLLKLAFLEDWISVNEAVNTKLIVDERIGKKDGFSDYKQYAKVHEGWPLVLQPNTRLLVYAKDYWPAAKCLYENFVQIPRYTYLPPPPNTFQHASSATFINNTNGADSSNKNSSETQTFFSGAAKTPPTNTVIVPHSSHNPGGP